MGYKCVDNIICGIPIKIWCLIPFILNTLP